MRLVLLASARSVHTRKWYSQLRKAGVDVHLITAAPFRDDSVEQIVVETGIFGKLGYIVNAGKVRRLIREIEPDIVHAYYASGYGWWGARSRCHPLLVSVWGSDITVDAQRSCGVRQSTKYALNRADVICATSRYLADSTLGLFPNVAPKVKLLPFGVDMNLFTTLPVRRFENVPLVFGAAKFLGHVYGFDLLLHAFRDVLTSLPAARLKIAGDGPAYRDLVDLSRSLGLSDSVEFLGYVPQEHMPAFLNSIDIFVMPSREEAFGVSAVEALACGVPVIGSRVGGIVEVLNHGDCGILVDPENVKALLDAMLSLAGDHEMRMRLSEKGREHVVANYDIGECTSMQIDIYEKLLAGGYSNRK
ncbi:MAG: glycosyltransferase family 4 protein [Candidatus Zixiibacteriota bacterium]